MEGSVLTPWGPSEKLRHRRLPPGPGKQRADVERNHRERLYGAMLAVVDEVGYEGVRVGRVAERAGVSRGALYEYFSGREECFLATFEALLDDGMNTVAKVYRDTDGDGYRQMRVALDALSDLLISQPAAARLCFLEAYAAGPPAAALRERATEGLEALVFESLADCPERSEMPPEIVSAILGGLRIVIQTRLRRRTEQELREIAPSIWGWMLSYKTPDPPLPRIRTRPAKGPRFVATSHEERLFVALTKTVHAKGYAETSVLDVANAASMSLSTFYSTFAGKEEAFLAACDFGVEHGFAAARHAYGQEAGWPRQVYAGTRELFTFLAAEPEWGYMAMVEILAAGPRARARRDRTLELFGSLMTAGHPELDELDPIVVEAVTGAVYSMMYSQIRNHGAERLPEILPGAVFVLLAPFIGNEAAALAASG